MNRHRAISNAVLSAMPGWEFANPLQGFGWAPERHLRAVLVKAGKKQEVVIRHSWSVSGFETERYLYESVLADLPFKTPELLGTFALNEDELPWMILEDIGGCSAANQPENRRLFLRLLGWLHGHGRCLCEASQLDGSRLNRFPANHSYYHEWEAILENGLAFGKYALPNSVINSCRRLREALAGEPQTLLHGDTDYSNAILTDDGMGLVDWERASIGPASVDLGRVVCSGESHDEMRSYCVAFGETSGYDLDYKQAVRIASLGVVFDSLQWICYYIKQVAEGNDPGEKWYRAYYEPCLDRVHACRIS